MTEYIMLLAIVVMIFTAIMKKLGDSDAFTKLKRPFTEDFKYSYRYGHPKARGQEDGGPVNIPQYQGNPAAASGDHNFRIFINPSKK